MPDTKDTSSRGYIGPAAYALADWRRRINDLYTAVRQTPNAADAHALWQTTRSELFRSHPMSPIAAEEQAAFPGLETFPYDPSLRFEVTLETITGAPVSHDLGADGMMTTRPLARTEGLTIACGAELTLFWITGYGGGIFLPFRDATSGDQTYGGGRYLADAIKGADLGLTDAGRMILDFNFSYTPSCAWNDAYVCPLSPPENTLPTAIRAGEVAPGHRLGSQSANAGNITSSATNNSEQRMKGTAAT
ncbi:MAG: DUF1684 domain-containing protein [Pseudomonadota bacterium]